MVAHYVGGGPVAEVAGYLAGQKAEGLVAKRFDRARKQFPKIGDAMEKWNSAQSAALTAPNPITQRALIGATVNLQKTLTPLGIKLDELTQGGPGTANAQPNQQNIPGSPAQQKNGGKVKQQKHFAQGGNASDDQYSDFRPSTNVEDYRNESPLHKAETNFMLNVTGQKDNWISDLSNAITGHKRQSAPQYAKGGKVKSTKAEVHYRAGRKDHHCSICVMWRPPHGCSAVGRKYSA